MPDAPCSTRPRATWTSYKALNDISRERQLTPEERAEQKKYSRLADAFTPLSKGMNSEYANQNAYDCVQVHGGSGFMMEYACQRLYRDARITSIYEGTTQLQVVAAIRYITNGTYLGILREMQAQEVSAELKPWMDKVKAMTDRFEEATNKVKEAGNQELQDLLARHLYEMAAVCVMSTLLITDAQRDYDLFRDSVRVYVTLAESEVARHGAFVMNFDAGNIESYRK